MSTEKKLLVLTRDMLTRLEALLPADVSDSALPPWSDTDAGDNLQGLMHRMVASRLFLSVQCGRLPSGVCFLIGILNHPSHTIWTVSARQPISDGKLLPWMLRRRDNARDLHDQCMIIEDETRPVQIANAIESLRKMVQVDKLPEIPMILSPTCPNPRAVADAEKKAAMAVSAPVRKSTITPEILRRCYYTACLSANSFRPGVQHEWRLNQRGEIEDHTLPEVLAKQKLPPVSCTPILDDAVCDRLMAPWGFASTSYPWGFRTKEDIRDTVDADAKWITEVGIPLPAVVKHIRSLMYTLEKAITNGKGKHRNLLAEGIIKNATSFDDSDLQKAGIGIWSGSDFLNRIPRYAGWKMDHMLEHIISSKEGIKWRVSMVIWRGTQDCPFQPPETLDPRVFSSGNRDLHITNLNTSKAFHISEASLHLLEDHAGFCGGRDCLYRVDLLAICECLGIPLSTMPIEKRGTETSKKEDGKEAKEKKDERKEHDLTDVT